jgi:hypothetical protein
MHIKGDIRVQIALESGCVFYFKHDSFTDSKSPPHYFVVLNEKKGDEVILIACATSQKATIDKQKKYRPAETFVEIDVGKYKHFDKQTFFDCNNVYQVNRADLILKIESIALGVYEPLPVDIVDCIKKAAMASPVVENWKKTLIGF